MFDHLESEIDADGGQVVVDEIVITEADEQGGFAYSLVAHYYDLKQEILLLYHPLIITIFVRLYFTIYFQILQDLQEEGVAYFNFLRILVEIQIKKDFVMIGVDT